MRKLDKRAISILVIATFLMSMIPIMPAQADMGDIYVSGYPKIADYPWTEVNLDIGNGHAWYNMDHYLSGEYSVELDPGTADTDAGRIWIPVDSIPFKDFDEPTFMVWEFAGADMGGSYDPITGLPIPPDTYYPYGHPYVNINLDLNGDGTYPTYGDDKLEAVGSLKVGGGVPTAETWTEMQEAWGYYDGDDSIDLASATPSAFSGHFVVHTFAEWKTYMLAEFPDAEVIGIEVTFGFWPGIVADAVYVDDVKCNGVLNHFEDRGVDQGDILTITGSGVTSGAPVNVYWDFVTTAGLKNNTVGKPDGTYELDLKIPSDVGGNHYIWVKDIGTGETKKYPTTIFVLPKLSLSPSSGLVGDEITIKGYGFALENDVTIRWDTLGTPITKTTTVETDELGYVTYKFDVPTGSAYGDYWIDATDEAGWTATKKYTVGASITLETDEGPTGTKVKVEGRGWTATETITFTMGGDPVQVVDDAVVTVKSGGTFSADIIIPDMGSKGDYEVEASETIVLGGPAKGPSHDHFEIDGLPKIKVNPTYGTPGAIITVTGYNFTQITGTIVTVTLDSIPESVLIDDAETKSDGTFEATFISPAVTFQTYDVTATDEYSIDEDDAFKVGLIALILNPVSGESGTMVSLTGIGFANGDYNVTFASSDESYTKLYEDYGTVSGEAIADPFYVPNVDPGTYTLTISDTDDNELTSTYTVTESTYVIAKPALAPVKYNVSLKGYHFADAVADVEFVIYNVTADGELDEDWDMTVQTTTGDTTPPDVDDTATDIDGNFTGWWKVDEDLSNGDYIINVTGGKGLLVQLDFSVVAARVSVTPRKALFARGDTVSFDISNDFPIEGTIEIYDPNDILYWITDLFYDGVGETADVWVLVEGLETVPYYSQTANANPMELASDAPLGTWTYFFYDGTKELMNSTFVVGVSTAAQIDEMLDDVRTEISDLGDALAGITDDVEDDIAGLSDEIAGVASDLAGLSDDIASDIADDIAQATDAGQAALGAVEDLAGSMRDLGDAVSDIATIAGDAADAAQSAADASNDAVQAAEDAQGAAQGLTTLVYGAIGASLIAALAAIVSLMQISRRIAG